MNNSNLNSEPKNEPILAYAPGSVERELLQKELERQYNQTIEIPYHWWKRGKNRKNGKVVMPTNTKCTGYLSYVESRSESCDCCRYGSKEKWEQMLGSNALLS